MAGVTNRDFWDFRVKTRAQFTKLAEQIANIDTSGGGGISELTSKMVVDALGYTPYNANNPANYITSDALSPYAKTADVSTTYATKDFVNNKLINYATIGSVTAIQNTLTGQIGAVNVSIEQLAATKLDSSYFTQTNIKSTLGISDWALAATKPSYAWSEITSRPTALSQFTDDVVAGKYLPLSGGDIWGSINLGQNDLNVSDDTSTYRAMRLYPDYGFYIGSGTSSNYDTLLWGKNIQFVSANGLTRMCVQSDGKVGIGTNSPNVLLTVNGALRAADSIYLHNTNEINSFQGKLYLNHHGSGLTGYGSTNDIVMVANGGNVGIGNTSPTERLDVSGNIKASGDITANKFIGYLRGDIIYDNGVDEGHFIGLGSNGVGVKGLLNYVYGNFPILFYTNGFERMRIGDYVGIGTTSPTERLDVSGNIKASGNINATSITINGVTITASNGSITVNGNVFATGDITGGV